MEKKCLHSKGIMDYCQLGSPKGLAKMKRFIQKKINNLVSFALLFYPLNHVPTKVERHFNITSTMGGNITPKVKKARERPALTLLMQLYRMCYCSSIIASDVQKLSH